MSMHVTMSKQSLMISSCIVCQEGLNPKLSITASPCGHVFHTICVNRWFESAGRRTCPQCRYEITSDNPTRILRLSALERTHDKRSSLQLFNLDISALQQKYLESRSTKISLKEKCLQLSSDIAKEVEKQRSMSDTFKMLICKSDQLEPDAKEVDSLQIRLKSIVHENVELQDHIDRLEFLKTALNESEYGLNTLLSKCETVTCAESKRICLLLRRELDQLKDTTQLFYNEISSDESLSSIECQSPVSGNQSIRKRRMNAEQSRKSNLRSIDRILNESSLSSNLTLDTLNDTASEEAETDDSLTYLRNHLRLFNREKQGTTKLKRYDGLGGHCLPPNNKKFK
ncbi:hypothetical protein GJ496_005933 [Pomphorhynchus laevis]|nr:hypothetical protein GJ496_005933 [Pomphorhynchus laevis]